MDLIFKKEGHIAEIIFNRPNAYNAMTWAMYKRLEEVCDAIDLDDSVNVVVLRGAKDSKAFVAGTDISQFSEFSSKGDAIAYEKSIDRVIGRIESLSKPTIAQINGYCVGGGAAIALACDFRYASHDLHFGIPIAKTLGNCLSMANLSRIVNLIGPARTKEMLMLARLLTSEEAKEVGVVNDIFPAPELAGEIQTVVDRLSGLAPLTLKATKEAIRRIQVRSTPSIEEGEDLIATCYTSEDFNNAVAAFIDKRKPKWRGK